MSWPRRIVLLLVVALLLGAIGYGFVPRAPRVETVAVQRAALRVTVREEGKTRVKDRYVLSAPLPGFAQRLFLKVGDTVDQNQTLLKIEPLRATLLDPRTRAEAQARVSVAKAQLKVAEGRATAAGSQANLAKTELRRVAKLHKAGSANQAELDRASADVRVKDALNRSAEFAVQVAQFELQGAQAALHYSASEDPKAGNEQIEVKSPLKAKVLRLFHESEGVLPAGGRIVEIGDPRALEVEVEVLSADAVKLAAGMRVLLDRWGGDPLEGKVRVVEPIGFTKVSALGVEEQRVLVIVDLLSPPEVWKALGDGYRVEATFILWEGPGVLQIPNSALFRGAAGWQVYVVQDERAQLRTVTLGHRNGLRSEVKQGLDPGEVVITHPGDQVTPGAVVRQRK